MLIRRHMNQAIFYAFIISALGCSDPYTATTAVGGETTGGLQAGAQAGEGGFSFGGSQITEEFECTDQDDLGNCAICGPTLRPIMPLNDTDCPYISCDSLTSYTTMDTEDGGRSCYIYEATTAAGNCKELGSCYEDPAEACTPGTTPELVLTVYPGCGDFRGCMGAESPDVSLSNEGASCHSLGTCGADGRCSAPPSCLGSVSNYVEKHCPEINSPQRCTLSVNMDLEGAADRISCRTACATRGGCQKAWDTSGSCQFGGEIGCTEERPRLICQCNRE